MNYQNKIYHILNRERDEMLHVLPQPDMLFRRDMTDSPLLHGGIRYKNKPDPGYFTPREPATLATGSSIGSMMPAEQRHTMMVEEAREGGKINWRKIGRSIGNFAKPIIKEIAPIAKKVVLDYGKQALMNYIVPAAETAVVAGAGRQRRRSGGAQVSIQDIPKKLPGHRPKEYIQGHQVLDANHNIVANERKKPAKKISELGVPPPNAGSKGRSLLRGVIIKRIMNERGVSMIEASKIVKAEGLY